MKSEKNEIIRAGLTDIETYLNQIKKDVEIIKFLKDDIDRIVKSIDFYIMEINEKIKDLKIRVGIKDGDNYG
jgi:hypothetical protein